MATSKTYYFYQYCVSSNDYKNVEDFEVKHGVKVPEDLAALLKGNGT